MPKSLYTMLRLNIDATQSEIKKQYLKLAKKWHPDRHSNKSLEEKSKAEETFKKILAAYEILSNEENRRKYDKGIIDENGKKILVQKSKNPPYSSQHDYDNHFFNKKDGSSRYYKKRTQSEPTDYYFFEDKIESEQFEQYFIPGVSTFVYVVYQDLNNFFDYVQEDINEHPSNTRCFYQKEPSESKPPHLKVEADGMHYAEEMISRLLVKVIIELMFNLSFNAQAYQSYVR